ncbi:hypothetical protein AXA44_42885 [Rhodococcus sp. SC4]|nr:hypothetical protein AXA44_42885 [Rhodococcus sp. SC4]
MKFSAISRTRCTMDDWVRTIYQARELVLERAPDEMPEKLGSVRSVIYSSWRRSRLQGLTPTGVTPVQVPDTGVGNYLARTVSPMIEQRAAALGQARCALALSDGEGRVLQRWAPDRGIAEYLDARFVAPSSSMAESSVGTTGAIAILNRDPILVRGPEHFSEQFAAFSCATAPIFHPINQSAVGSLSLITRISDTSPIMLSWVTELATLVEALLRARASRREQLLLDAYTAHNRDARHPLVALDENTVINNAAAARLLAPVDQALLWEHARRGIADSMRVAGTMTLPDGKLLTIECQPVSDGIETIGAVLRIKQPHAQQGASGLMSSRRAPALPGLVGHGMRWQALCKQACAVAPGPIVIVGETGSGKLAVARALAGRGPLRVVDAAEVSMIGEDQWCHRLESQLGGPDECLVVRHIHLLEGSSALASAAALRRRPAGRRVLATVEARAFASPRHSGLLDLFDTVLEVPALRDRTEDLPALLAAFTTSAAGEGHAIRWSPEVIQLLSRMDWPGNLSSLRALVCRLVTGGHERTITPQDLPPNLAARASRRQLASLEQAEAQAILQALRDAGGNKYRAAMSLGIARSTLYRKVRALGLDLSASAY